MSSPPSTLPRRGLNARQVETVERLFDAAAELVEESGYEVLTIRLVAGRAGASAATAYTYFSSKDHLVAALFWRHVASAPVPEPPPGLDPVGRLQHVVVHLAAVMAASPALAAAATKSLLGSDPAVAELRLRLGGHWHALFAGALGEAASPVLLDTLTDAFAGALLQAGMGILDYADLGPRLESAVALIARGGRRVS
ncbi:MAG: TetR/AcrR family transcriptional regulator [Marmoricola sp.]